MKQTWHDLFFAHWPIPFAELRPLVPARLTAGYFRRPMLDRRRSFLDERRSCSRAAGSARVLASSRTQRADLCDLRGQARSLFLQLGCHQSTLRSGARATLYHLPYFHAAMEPTRGRAESFYTCERDARSLRSRGGRGVRPTRAGQFVGSYRPTGSSHPRRRERSKIFSLRVIASTRSHQNQVYRCDIHHLPWPLQDAEASIERNTMAAVAPALTLPDSAPLLSFLKDSRCPDLAFTPRR